MVIGIAGKDGTHLNMLSTIALICADEENIEFIKNAKSAEEVAKAINEFEPEE